MMAQAGAVPQAFQAHFAAHNRRALVFSLFSLVAAVVLWLALYLFFYWATMMTVTILKGADAGVPPSFKMTFVICALVLCFLGLVAERLWPDYFPVDRKGPLEVLMDVVLAVPRVTLAVSGNLSACIFLNHKEMELAWDLLMEIAREGRLGIRKLPLMIADPALCARIVFALQLAGLIKFRKEGEDSWLGLEGDEARALTQRRVRIEAAAERSVENQGL